MIFQKKLKIKFLKNYNGDSVLEMVNELHMDLLNIVLRELFEKNKFEEFKENNPDSKISKAMGVDYVEREGEKVGEKQTKDFIG